MTRRCRGRTISRKNPVHVLLAIENNLRLLWGRGGMESQAHSFRCDFQPTVTGLYYLYLIFNFLFTMLAIVLRRYKLCEFQRSVLTSKSAPLLPPPPPHRVLFLLTRNLMKNTVVARKRKDNISVQLI